MAEEPGSTGFGDGFPIEWSEYLPVPLFNPDLFAFEIPLSQNDPGLIPPSTSLDLEYLYDLLLEAPPGGQSTQGIAPDSSLTPHDIPDSSSFPPQIASPVDDIARFCALCSTSTPPPPIHAPQAATFPPPGWLEIPQTVYKQKQWDFKPLEPILFHVNGRPGVNMGDAFRKTFAGLDGRDDLMLLQDARVAVSCRFSFPGYPRNSSPQISTKKWDKGRGPMMRSELAHQVARKLKQYLDSMTTSHSIDGSTDKQWEIGEGFMGLDNMYLVRLVSVSVGSFQPEIWVVDPTV